MYASQIAQTKPFFSMKIKAIIKSSQISAPFAKGTTILHIARLYVP